MQLAGPGASRYLASVRGRDAAARHHDDAALRVFDEAPQLRDAEQRVALPAAAQDSSDTEGHQLLQSQLRIGRAIEGAVERDLERPCEPDEPLDALLVRRVVRAQDAEHHAG